MGVVSKPCIVHVVDIFSSLWCIEVYLLLHAPPRSTRAPRRFGVLSWPPMIQGELKRCILIVLICLTFLCLQYTGGFVRSTNQQMVMFSFARGLCVVSFLLTHPPLKTESGLYLTIHRKIPLVSERGGWVGGFKTLTRFCRVE